MNAPSVPAGMNLAYVLPAYVYFLSDGRYTKIGASIRPLGRQKHCGIGDTKLLFALFVPLPFSGYAVESALHRHYSAKRIPRIIGNHKSKEWFDLTSEDLVSVKTLAVYSRYVVGNPKFCFCECHPYPLWSSKYRQRSDRPIQRVPIGFVRPKLEQASA